MSSLGDWNPLAGRRWNRLRTALRREYPGIEFFRAVEVQVRGALHLHVLIAADGWIDPFVVQRLAVAAGFGCMVDLADIVPGSRRHAYYVSKYVTKGTDDKIGIPWSVDLADKRTGEIRRVQAPANYRAWSTSHGWGLRMKDVRAALRAAHLRRLATLQLAGSGHELEPRTVPAAGLVATAPAHSPP